MKGRRNFGQRYSSREVGSNNKTCYRCGGRFPYEKKCLDGGKFCNLRGHFAKCCKQKQEGVERAKRIYRNDHSTTLLVCRPILRLRMSQNIIRS